MRAGVSVGRRDAADSTGAASAVGPAGGVALVVEAAKLHSRGRNTAFQDRRFQGRAQMTFVGGEAVFKRA